MPFGQVAQSAQLNPEAYSPNQVDGIWFRRYYNKIPIYPIFYLLKGRHNQTIAVGKHCLRKRQECSRQPARVVLYGGYRPRLPCMSIA